MTKKAVTVIYACPVCEQRIEMLVPTNSAICHNKHRAEKMRVVEDASSTATTARP